MILEVWEADDRSTTDILRMREQSPCNAELPTKLKLRRVQFVVFYFFTFNSGDVTADGGAAEVGRNGPKGQPSTVMGGGNV